MSKYGRLYDQASDVRRALQALLPNELTGNFTPADARAKVRQLVKEVDALADRWEATEGLMKREDD